jgi:tetratricopeptide (TPR) repeat protein
MSKLKHIIHNTDITKQDVAQITGDMKEVRTFLGQTGKKISVGKLLCKDAWRWLRIWKTFPVYPWLKAAQAFRSGEYLESAEYYRRGLLKYSTHPAHFSARYDLAYCLERCGEFEKAIDELAYITGDRHPFHDAYVSKSALEHYMGRNSAALETIRKGLSIFPDSPELSSGFVHISLLSGLARDEAEIVIEELRNNFRTTAERPADEQTMINVALAHYELVFGDAVKGDSMLVRALCSDQVPVEAYLIRGKRLFSNGKMLQARELFRRAMILSQSNPYPLMLLAESYLASEVSEEIHWAKQLAESACRMSRWKNVEAVELLGRVYEKNKEKEKAELFLERIRHMSQAVFIPLRKPGRDIMLRHQRS